MFKESDFIQNHDEVEVLELEYPPIPENFEDFEPEDPEEQLVDEVIEKPIPKKPKVKRAKKTKSPVLPPLLMDGSIDSVRIQDEFSKYIQNQEDIAKQELVLNEIAQSKIATAKAQAAANKEKAQSEQQEMKARQMRGELIEVEYAKWLFLGQSKVMCKQLCSLFQRHKVHLEHMSKNQDSDGIAVFFQNRITEILEEAKKFCRNEMKEIGNNYGDDN